MMRTALVASLLAFAGSAYAEYICEGPVNGVTVSTTGIVTAAEVGGLYWPYLCMLNGTTTLNTSADTCKAIYALLLTAQSSGKRVRLWFNDGGDCTESSHPRWQNLTGWYFGPMLVEN